jgi:hypothetical protein
MEYAHIENGYYFGTILDYKMVHHRYGRNKCPLTLEQRFLQYVNKTETCWLWTGYIRQDGYANFRPISTSTTQLAHRVAYELWNGVIPDGSVARHKCDVRNCVNPEHLELGTHTDNMRDMFERNRQANVVGVNNPRAKLTEENVREIRVLLDKGLFQQEIACMFGVTQTAISRIKRRVWGGGLI